MKKILLLITVCLHLLLLSCGDSKNEESTKLIPGMMELSIKINGNNLLIMVPDSTNGKLNLIEQPWGATEIKVGVNYQLSIEEADGDIALIKSDISGNEVFKLTRYLKDEPSMLFWEAKNENMPDPRFHFYLITKVGELNYVIKETENGDAYNEKSINTMIISANTLKTKILEKIN